MTSTSSDQPALLAFGPLVVADGGTFRLRTAEREDVTAILGLLADDRLGSCREDTSDLTPYLAAFEAIDASPAQLLMVGEWTPGDGAGGRVAATFQLSFLPGLSRRGSCRAQLEAVRVTAELRSHGVGAAMVEWAIGESRRRGCSLMQLTTDKSRTGAHRFYERLGFAASHEGMKLAL